jgi:predicted ATPase
VQADALLTLATAQGFPLFMGHGALWRGWALAMQGQGEVGLGQMQQGLAAVLATGQTLPRPYQLVQLAEALRAFEASKRGDMLTEAYRLQGELLLRRALPEESR